MPNETGGLNQAGVDHNEPRPTIVIPDQDRPRVVELIEQFKSVSKPEQLTDEVIDDLIGAWGNEDWPAERDYLRAVAESTLAGQEAIFECGSGITTLVIAALAGLEGTPVHALEQEPDWVAIMSEFKIDCDLELLDLRYGPLRSYGDFDWYTYPKDWSLNYSLVVCDGPPWYTRGGRYGLFPVLHESLIGATILLDDFDRDDEQAIAARWSTHWPVTFTRVERGTRPYGVGAVAVNS